MCDSNLIRYARRSPWFSCCVCIDGKKVHKAPHEVNEWTKNWYLPSGFFKSGIFPLSTHYFGCHTAKRCKVLRSAGDVASLQTKRKFVVKIFWCSALFLFWFFYILNSGRKIWFNHVPLSQFRMTPQASWIVWMLARKTWGANSCLILWDKSSEWLV